MRTFVALAAVLGLAGCAAWREFEPGRSTLADVEAAMGPAAEQRARPNGETWVYYPLQPFGRKVSVARFAPDRKLIAVEQRLSEEYIARLVPNQSRKEDVRNLLGPPYEALFYPRLERDTWSWHMRRFANLPAGLHVQMSPDGVVREVYVLDEQRGGERKR